jgi:hypothetical protein
MHEMIKMTLRLSLELIEMAEALFRDMVMPKLSILAHVTAQPNIWFIAFAIPRDAASSPRCSTPNV